MRRAPIALLILLLAGSAEPALACFGTHLRVGFAAPRAAALAAFALGYYVEEKTGIEPEFSEWRDSPADLLGKGELDLCLVPATLPVPQNVTARAAPEIPGLPAQQFWIRPDVLEDLRFFTVGRTLDRTSALFGSAAYGAAAASAEPARRAARQAVLHAD